MWRNHCVNPLSIPADEVIGCVSAGQWYRQVSPHCWAAEHVLEWISDHVESTKVDASTLSLALCSMDGPALCQMSREQLVGVFGPQLGLQLHQSLQEHKTKYGKLHPPCWNDLKKKGQRLNILICN